MRFIVHLNALKPPSSDGKTSVKIFYKNDSDMLERKYANAKQNE